jgi:hypothetical protein
VLITRARWPLWRSLPAQALLPLIEPHAPCGSLHGLRLLAQMVQIPRKLLHGTLCLGITGEPVGLPGSQRPLCRPLVAPRAGLSLLLDPLFPVWSKNSCGFTLIVFEETAKPFATPNRACSCCVVADSRKEQDIPFALMIALVMIVLDILLKCMAERRFTKKDKSRQALLFDESHPALRVGVQIR